MYNELRPSLKLQGLVDTFWTFTAQQATDKFKVVPDTCVDMIFDLNKNRAFYSGVMAHYQFRGLEPDANLVAIRFKIEKIGLWCSTPQDEIKNQRVDLSDVFPCYCFASMEQLQELKTAPERINWLERELLKVFRQNQKNRDMLVVKVAAYIRSVKGVVCVKSLAASNHISLRQLERRFKTRVGLTIKEFSNLVRFDNAKDTIKNGTQMSLLQIAYDAGYFDHAHMNYEFKRLSGDTPSHFR